MYKCRYCGRDLNEGEICNCQAGNQNMGAANMGNGQSMGAAFNAAGNQNMGAANMGGNQNMGATNMGGYQNMAGAPYMQGNGELGSIGRLLKNLFTHPVNAITEYVRNAKLANTFITIIILAACSMLATFATIVGYNIKYPGSNYYTVASTIKSILSNGIGVLVACVLFAVTLFLIVSLIDKSENVSFSEGLAIASLIYIIAAPISIIGSVISLIPLSFFSDVSGWISRFGSALGTFYAFMGIRAAAPNEDKLPIIYAIAVVIMAIGGTIIGLIL